MRTLEKTNVGIANTCTLYKVSTLLSNVPFFQQNKLTITLNKMITPGKSY